MEAPIEVRGLTLKSGSRVLQKGLDFAAGPGQMLAVVGESGTGKRALLRVMAGREAPAEGDVFFSGVPYWSSPDEERRRLTSRIGVAFARGALLSTKTLLENVALPLEAHTTLSAREVGEVARFKLAALGLAGHEQHLPTEVDEQKRVAAGLARATALDPEILFCERPTEGLDPRASARVTEALGLARDRGATVVVVSSDPLLAQAADEVVFLGLESRTLKAKGRPDWLRDHATDPDVRAFLQGGRP